ncbi:MAG: hypothetical protein OSB09_07165 [Planctomycetota bacterium]|nr:hypothetical protein [Planctomycetota bacterium]
MVAVPLLLGLPTGSDWLRWFLRLHVTSADFQIPLAVSFDRATGPGPDLGLEITAQHAPADGLKGADLFGPVLLQFQFDRSVFAGDQCRELALFGSIDQQPDQ